MFIKSIKNIDSNLNQLNNNIIKVLKSGLMGFVLLSLSNSIDLQSKEIKSNNVEYIKEYNIKITGDLEVDGKVIKQEIFKNIIDESLKNNLLVEKLKYIIINDATTNVISLENKMIFTKYIAEPKNPNLYLEAKNKLIELINNHNLNSPKVLKIMDKELNKADDNLSMINETNELTIYINKLYNLSDVVANENYNLKDVINVLKENNILSKKTLLMFNDYQNIDKIYDNKKLEYFYKTNVLKFNDNMFDRTKISIAKEEILFELYNKIKLDLNNTIIEKQTLFDNSGRKFNFLQDEIKILKTFNEDFNTPIKSILSKEKIAITNLITKINDFDYKNGIELKLIKLPESNLKDTSIDKDFLKSIFVTNETIKSLSELPTLAKSFYAIGNLTELKRIESQIFELNNKDKKEQLKLVYETNVMNLIDYINQTYQNDFNKDYKENIGNDILNLKINDLLEIEQKGTIEVDLHTR